MADGDSPDSTGMNNRLIQLSHRAEPHHALNLPVGLRCGIRRVVVAYHNLSQPFSRLSMPKLQFCISDYLLLFSLGYLAHTAVSSLINLFTASLINTRGNAKPTSSPISNGSPTADRGTAELDCTGSSNIHSL